MAKFQSTRPVRGATSPSPPSGGGPSISIHAPRAGRDQAEAKMAEVLDEISIHAPRAGRDDGLDAYARMLTNFNPRAPCGARLGGLGKEMALAQFQSTRPVRGAT